MSEVSTEIPAIDALEAAVLERAVPYTLLRAHAGELVKCYFGSDPDVQLLNELNRDAHPLS